MNQHHPTTLVEHTALHNLHPEPAGCSETCWFEPACGATAMAVLFLVTTAVVAFNTLYFKRMLNCYRSDSQPNDSHDYAVFVSVFDILLWAIFMSVAGRIGGALQHNVPKRGLLRAACADQLGTLLASLGATHVPGQMQVLLNQSVLPLTMLLSLGLGRRYGMQHFLGAALVLAGAGAAIQRWPESLDKNQLFWRSLMIFCLAQIAVASSTLIKEVLLTRTSSNDVTESMAVGVAIAWRRVPMGVFLALLMPSSQGSKGLAADLKDGFLCFCGYQPREGDLGCARAAPTTLISVTLYAIQTFLCLRLTQQKGATIRSIAAVTSVPFAQLLFSREGDLTEALSSRSLLGLVLCLSGFATYSLADRQKQTR